MLPILFIHFACNRSNFTVVYKLHKTAIKCVAERKTKMRWNICYSAYIQHITCLLILTRVVINYILTTLFSWRGRPSNVFHRFDSRWNLSFYSDICLTPPLIFTGVVQKCEIWSHAIFEMEQDIWNRNKFSEHRWWPYVFPKCDVVWLTLPPREPSGGPP